VRVVGFDDSLYIVVDPEAKTPKPETKVPNDVRPCPKQVESPAYPEPEVEQQTEPSKSTEVMGEPAIEIAGITLDQSRHKNLRQAILEGVQKKLSGRKDDGKKWKGTKKMTISAVRKTELREADDIYREEEQRLLKEAFVEGADLEDFPDRELTWKAVESNEKLRSKWQAARDLEMLSEVDEEEGIQGI